ncbi:MAG: hypothetical protein LBU22_13605 [Dysgonamonadaceae bacterium]|jgi:hypothetical protein|nr:hypothetical protein [Dysgonamonadaceae bacterium]
MNILLKTKIFSLLNETSPETVSQQAWEKAYNELADTLFSERTSASDRESLYNALCYASAEFKSLQSDCNNSKKKHCF